jgi:CubicO group peptidase (beta-lactamase class C family)
VGRPLDTRGVRAAAQRLVDDGLPACQVAVARHGEVVWAGTFGDATDTTRFRIASAVKPVVASAVLVLLGEGQLSLADRVADHIPEFGTRGKDVVTVEQLLVFSGGFPHATLPVEQALVPGARAARFAEWESEWEPGTRFEYHASSAHWVMAELIERCSGVDYRDFVHARVSEPLGLGRILGIPPEQQADIAGMTRVDGTREADVDRHPVPTMDPFTMIEVGTPSGGGVMTAGTLARFYQALLHDPAGIWKPGVLADATAVVRNAHPEPRFHLPANRTIGSLVIGGGFGSAWATFDLGGPS